jgi:DNA-directed RNA polymerase subunit RPC12/RpoP
VPAFDERRHSFPTIAKPASLSHYGRATNSKGRMKELKFSCPHCQQHLQVDEQFSGREIQCPSCRHLIRIPPIPGKTVGYKPESGKTWATHVPNAPRPPGLSIKQRKDTPEPPAS